MKKALWAIVCLALVGCTKGTLIHRYETVGQQGWERTDTLVFALPEVATQGQHRLTVSLRYDNTFPYEGIWLVVEGHLKDPSQQWRDTVYFATADEEGTPLGHGVSLMQNDVVVRDFQLSEGQSGSLRLWHIMHREVMPEIRDVGIKIEQTDCDRHPYAGK